MGYASCHAEESGLLGEHRSGLSEKETELVAAEALIPAPTISSSYNLLALSNLLYSHPPLLWDLDQIAPS